MPEYVCGSFLDIKLMPLKMIAWSFAVIRISPVIGLTDNRAMQDNLGQSQATCGVFTTCVISQCRRCKEQYYSVVAKTYVNSILNRCAIRWQWLQCRKLFFFIVDWLWERLGNSFLCLFFICIMTWHEKKTGPVYTPVLIWANASSKLLKN